MSFEISLLSAALAGALAMLAAACYIGWIFDRRKTAKEEKKQTLNNRIVTALWLRLESVSEKIDAVAFTEGCEGKVTFKQINHVYTDFSESSNGFLEALRWKSENIAEIISADLFGCEDAEKVIDEIYRVPFNVSIQSIQTVDREHIATITLDSDEIDLTIRADVRPATADAEYSIREAIVKLARLNLSWEEANVLGDETEETDFVEEYILPAVASGMSPPYTLEELHRAHFALFGRPYTGKLVTDVTDYGVVINCGSMRRIIIPAE